MKAVDDSRKRHAEELAVVGAPGAQRAVTVIHQAPEAAQIRQVAVEVHLEPVVKGFDHDQVAGRASLDLGAQGRRYIRY